MEYDSLYGLERAEKCVRDSTMATTTMNTRPNTMAPTTMNTRPNTMAPTTMDTRPNNTMAGPYYYEHAS